MRVTLTISDVQKHLKEKILPLMEMGQEVIVEDAKSQEKKFMIVPIPSSKKPKWPDFHERASGIKALRDLTAVLVEERGRA